MKRILSLIIAVLLFGTTALAMPVRSNDGKMTLSCVVDEENVDIEVDEFQLLGTGSDGRYLIYANGDYYSLFSIRNALTQNEMNQILEMSSVKEAEIASLSRGAKSDEVAELQKTLIDLGFLNGTADGDFGAKTQDAINSFQASLGLPQTGTADARLRMLVASMQQPELVLGGSAGTADSGSSLAALCERAGVDAQAFYDSGLTLDYDDIAGVGFISDGTEVLYETGDMSDIDQYTLSLVFGFYVQDDAGTTTIAPAVKVSCLCVRRPVVEEVMLKSGDYRGAAPIDDLIAQLNGVKTEERGVALLNDGMVEALANASSAGELKIRINGRYNSFDLSVDQEQLASLAKIGEICKGL